MSKIAFFCIPAHGHTNPTLEVVRELINRGNEVWYYSFTPFKEKISSTGAKFIACDEFDAEQKLTPEDGARIGKDIAFSTKVLVDTTLALDDKVCRDMQEFKPDCIVADSMAFWGKAAAMKLNIPFISSTTTFAFNKYSARIMKQSIGQLFKTIFAMQIVKKDIKRLQDKGYPIKNILSMIQNDNDTNTIVYTSREFQPCAETFSGKYSFVGPSIQKVDVIPEKTDKKTIYISMGTVNNMLMEFYKNCIAAFKDSNYKVIMSVGELTNIEDFGELPANFSIYNSVKQIEVLQNVDVFVSHCGMNSVNESLYFEVPLVMFPQTTEQGGVARRVSDLGAGVYLQKNSAEAIAQAVNTVLGDTKYKSNAIKISEGFKKSGGTKEAVDSILKVALKK